MSQSNVVPTPQQALTDAGQQLTILNGFVAIVQGGTVPPAAQVQAAADAVAALASDLNIAANAATATATATSQQPQTQVSAGKAAAIALGTLVVGGLLVWGITSMARGRKPGENPIEQEETPRRRQRRRRR